MFTIDAGDVTEDMLGGNFEPLPENIYDFRIKSVEETTTRANDPMVKVVLEVIDSLQYDGRLVFHNVTFLPKGKNGRGFAFNFLKSIGEQWQGENLKINCKNWVGAKVRGTVNIREFEGKKYNGVTTVMPYEKKEDDGKEEVPF